MILTAYLNESGTHGDSPVTIMAGVMANASQWACFEAQFNAMKSKHRFRVLRFEPGGMAVLKNTLIEKLNAKDRGKA